MAVSGGYLAGRARWSAQPFVRAYGQWVNEHILPMKTAFDKQAQAIEEETYQSLAAQANPDTGDDGDLHERAFDASLSFYETIVSLYQATLNLFSAGLFHPIEQQLADLTHDAAMEIAVPDSSFASVKAYYLERFMVDLTIFSSWDVIEELHWVANAAKHGEGHGAEKLRGIRPDQFQHPALRFSGEAVDHFPLHLPLGGDGLYVMPEDFKRYENAANGLFDFVIEKFESNENQYFPL